MTTVVNIRSGASYDVLCDRTTPFGNHVGQGKGRFRAVLAYSRWIEQPEQAEFRERVRRELKDKVLGCWCKPKICHCDILAKIADGGEE